MAKGKFWSGVKDTGRFVADLALTPAESFAGDFYEPKYETEKYGQALSKVGAGIDKYGYAVLPYGVGIATGVGVGIATGNPMAGFAAGNLAMQGTKGLQSSISGMVTTPEEKRLMRDEAERQQKIAQEERDYYNSFKNNQQMPTFNIPAPPSAPLSQTGTSPQVIYAQQPEVGGYRDQWAKMRESGLYRKGGIVPKNTKINIEKGEIEVNPETLEVIRKFEAPKHPKDGSKNPKGDRYVKEGNAIVPANKSMQYMRGDAMMKQRIINGLPRMMKDGMAQGGYGDPDFVGPPEDYQYYTYQQPQYQYQYQPESTKKSGGGSSSYVNLSGLGMGIYQWIEANKALKALGKQPLPTLTDYTLSPEWQKLQTAYQRAEKLSETGYTPEERTAFEKGLAGQSAVSYRRGLDVGAGGLAGALSAGIQAQQTGAVGRFAAEDAALKRRNIAYSDSLARTLASSMQSQQNLMTQGQREYERMLYNRRLMTEQALARAKAQGMENVAGSVNISGEDIGKLVAAF